MLFQPPRAGSPLPVVSYRQKVGHSKQVLVAAASHRKRRIRRSPLTLQRGILLLRALWRSFRCDLPAAGGRTRRGKFTYRGEERARRAGGSQAARAPPATTSWRWWQDLRCRKLACCTGELWTQFFRRRDAAPARPSRFEPLESGFQTRREVPFACTPAPSWSATRRLRLPPFANALPGAEIVRRLEA